MPDYDHLDDLDDDLWVDLVDPGDPPGEIPPDELELEKIPRRLWEQTLAPIRTQARFYVAQRVPDEQLRELAHEVVDGLNRAEHLALQSRDVSHHRARRTGAPLPDPDPDHVATRRTAQLNMRLRRDDYERLREAAAAVGMKPTTLARALVLNGVAKVLRERGAT